MEDMNVEKGWRLSTSHLTKRDNEILCGLCGVDPKSDSESKSWDAPDAPIMVTSYDGGFLFTIWFFDWTDDDSPYHEFVCQYDLSPALYAILALAAEEEVRYVRFDCDADKSKCFGTFKW